MVNLLNRVFRANIDMTGAAKPVGKKSITLAISKRRKKNTTKDIPKAIPKRRKKYILSKKLYETTHFIYFELLPFELQKLVLDILLESSPKTLKSLASTSRALFLFCNQFVFLRTPLEKQEHTYYKKYLNFLCLNHKHL